MTLDLDADRGLGERGEDPDDRELAVLLVDVDAIAAGVSRLLVLDRDKRERAVCVERDHERDLVACRERGQAEPVRNAHVHEPAVDDRDVENVSVRREVDPLELQFVRVPCLLDVSLVCGQPPAADIGVDVDLVAGPERAVIRARALCGAKPNDEDAVTRGEHEACTLPLDHDALHVNVLGLAQRAESAGRVRSVRKLGHACSEQAPDPGLAGALSGAEGANGAVSRRDHDGVTLRLFGNHDAAQGPALRDCWRSDDQADRAREQENSFHSFPCLLSKPGRNRGPRLDFVC